MKNVQIMKLDILTCAISGFRPPVDLILTTGNDSSCEDYQSSTRETTDTESGTSKLYLPL